MTHRQITLEHYLGPYADHPQMRAPLLLQHAGQIIAVTNELCALAEADGVDLQDNPATGTAISGSGNGGARPYDCPVGAPSSAHKDLRGLDRYDPRRALMRWLLSYGLEHCQRLGVYLEHPQWTRSWSHIQFGAPGDGLTRWNVVFVPYADQVRNPPTCEALPEQRLAGLQDFAFKPVKKAA